MNNTIDSSCSIATTFQLNYLLLYLWFRKFVGQLDKAESKQSVDCEILGTPVLERVFVEPYFDLSVDDRNTFWIGEDNPNKEEISLTIRKENYLLHLGFRTFSGRLDIPKSKHFFECEVLGTPVPERVFVEPYSNLSVDRNTFWIGKNNPNKEKFLLSVQEEKYFRTAYIKAFVSPRRELLIDNYSGSEIFSIERELNDRFQSFLRTFLEVDC